MRALVGIAGGLLLGLTLRSFGLRLLSSPWIGLLTLGLGLALLSLTRERAARPSRRGAALLFALGLLAGASVAPPRGPGIRWSEIPPPGSYRLEVEVQQRRGDRSKVRLLRGRSLEGEELSPGLPLSLRGLRHPVGSRLRLVARLRPAARFENPSPRARWPAGEEVAAVGRALGEAIVLRPPPLHRLALSATRERIEVALERTLSPPAAGLALALILGRRGALERDRRESLRRAGLAHALAVSGLHVTLVTGLLVALLLALLSRSERLARRTDLSRWSALAGIPLALLYAALAGWPPSAQRAALTLSLGLGLHASGRRPRPLAVAAAAAIFLAALDPEEASRPPFLLSVAATAAILSGLLQSEGGPIRRALMATLRATLATAPIVLICFGELPLAGLLSNLLLVPLLASLLLPLALAHAALATLLPPLSALSAPPLEGLCRAFLAGAELLGGLGAELRLPPPDRAEALILGLAAAGLLLTRRWRHRLAVALLAALALSGAELRLRSAERPRGALRLSFLDVGQGDAALIDLPDGQLMLVDAGGALLGAPDPGEEVILPLLRARRRDRIDLLVVSHPHPDHFGGVAALLEAVERGELSIGELWDSGQGAAEEPEGRWARELRRAQRLGIRLRSPPELCAAGHRHGGATIEVRGPCPRYDPGWGPNENSLILELRLGRRRFLLLGDAEAHAEALLLEGGLPGPLDVLKVGHHGSRTSSGEALLRALQPGWAVVSAGRGNPFGHPHPEVMERLRARSDRVWRVDREGGLILRSDGSNLIRDPTSIFEFITDGD